MNGLLLWGIREGRFVPSRAPLTLLWLESFRYCLGGNHPLEGHSEERVDEKSLKKSLGAPFTGIWVDMLIICFFYARSVRAWEFQSCGQSQDSRFHRYVNHQNRLIAEIL